MRITGILAAIASLGMIAVTVPSQAQSPMTKDQLIGTWQIVSYKATPDEQTRSYPVSLGSDKRCAADEKRCPPNG
jgi:hypothetical protein